MNLITNIFTKKYSLSNGSGLYIDIENLQEDAKSLISALLDQWPDSFPRPSLVTLYVPGDQVELWRMWAITQFRKSEIRVRGVQRFSGHLSKNSADIAIASDVIADFVRRRVKSVAVFSDDSDFMSLYVKIREEAPEEEKANPPFLWVLTDRRGTKSLNIRRYFPNEHNFVVKTGQTSYSGRSSGRGTSQGSRSYANRSSGRSSSQDNTSYSDRNNFRGSTQKARSYTSRNPGRGSGKSFHGNDDHSASTNPKPKITARDSGHNKSDSIPEKTKSTPTSEKISEQNKAYEAAELPLNNTKSKSDPSKDRAIATEIVDKMPLGLFKSTDCRDVVKNIYPDHPLANGTSGAVGQRFVKYILPILLEMGVTEPNPNRRPRRFEITENAKQALNK
ncbi:MAG: hypothetical protein CL904_05010 [Dehalococcoidia bacterium]|nr:hypothetical protein [Dehalococcoidia bacterium]MQG15936.1 NYN domain-containing protein [SAR202 cluster bacterium]